MVAPGPSILCGYFYSHSSSLLSRSFSALYEDEIETLKKEKTSSYHWLSRFWAQESHELPGKGQGQGVPEVILQVDPISLLNG